MRRYVIAFVVTGLVALGAGASWAQEHMPDPMMPPNIEAVLDGIAHRLERLRAAAVQRQDGQLAESIERLSEALRQARERYAAGDVAGAWRLTFRIRAALADLMRRLGPMPPPPDSVAWMPPDSAGIAQALERTRTRIDTLAQLLAEQPVPRADSLLSRASALADTVQARLEAGHIRAAAQALRRTHMVLARAYHLVRADERLSQALERARAQMDTLSQILAEHPNARAESLLVRAEVLADSVETRLEAGHIRAAEVGMQRLHRLLVRVQRLIHLDATLTRVLEAFRQKLAEVEPTIAESGDSLAQALYAQAIEAADSAEARLAEGKPRAAQAALHRAERKLAHALFIVTAPERAEREIAELRERIARLLETLPADAYRERGIAERASAWADSAQAALERGETFRALHIVRKIHRALDRLMAHVMPTPPMSLEMLMTRAHEIVNEVLAQMDSVETDSLDRLVGRALAYMNGIPSMMHDRDRAYGMAMQAYHDAMRAADMLIGEDQTATDGTDPIEADLIEAGEKAAREAQPLAVAEDAARPTEYALSVAPNPFNPSATIRYALAADGPVHLAVYNLLGQQVRLLADGTMSAGTYEARWDGRDDAGNRLASGVYFVRLATEQKVMVTRLVLSR